MPKEKEAVQEKEDRKAKREKKKKRKDTDLLTDEMDQEEEKETSKVLIFFVSLLIVLIWLGIIGVLIKCDVGGFGSSVLYPMWKDVPYLNRILPDVGNLVCPAEFDTGATKNAMILSVPEGDDKPLKYPLMFSVCDVVLINKCDALPVFQEFDKEAVEQRIKELNPNAEIFFVSAKTGEGFDQWINWVRTQVAEYRGV